MVRIKYTGGTSAVQMQQTPVQNKTQSESEETSGVRFQESLVLQQQQSLEMVQIMLHVSFGTLFYLREFLPLGCFDDRDLKQAQREQKYSYEEFIHSNERGSPDGDQEPVFGKGKRGQPLKIILRDSDPKADMILDLLEHGIFEALSKNFLEAIQLTILVDKDQPQNVLETYTFSFKYTGARGDVNSRLESLSLNPVGCVADMRSAQSARAGLEMVVRRLITMSAFLPILPNKRSLGIHLFYTEDCPPDYEPPGFAMSTDDMIKYPLDENWQRESQSCGTMDSGCHAVGLNVTSLKWTGPDPESSEALPEVPDQIKYNETVERAVDIGPVNLVNQDSGFLEATQDITERQKLQMMISTQASSCPDSDLVPTQPINKRATRDDTPVDTQGKMNISHEKAMQIDEYSRIQIPGLTRRASNQGLERVKCQCGWDGEETAMMTCSFCHTCQHLLCYGFESSDDPRIPDTHACYQCLFEPDETNLLHEMNTVVLLRRALRIILNEGFPNKTSIFTHKLHCNGQTVIQITDLLRKQRFLQSTPGSKSKGFLQKGLPKFVVPTGDDTRERMQREILDPFAKIRHHYYLLQGRGPSFEAKLAAFDETVPQDQSSSMKDTEIPLQETQGSNNEVSETSGDSLSRKRKQAPNGDHDRSYCRDHQHQQQEDSAGARNDGLSQYTLTNGSRIHSQPSTPSDRRRSEENHLRRSNRKRRKISNFTQFIDVGASSSGDEGG